MELWWIPVVVVAIFIAAILVLRVSGRRGATTESVVPRTRPAPVEVPPPRRTETLSARIRSLFGGAVDDPWARLEELLVKADVGPSTAGRVVSAVRDRYTSGSDPVELVSDEVAEILAGDGALDLPEGRLAVIMVVGVNGSGKTTTIGKLASRLARAGRSVSLAGSDTFRAAASEQLDVWARRADAHLVTQQRGADPGSVAFDAVKAAEARGSDVLIVDTAGRLHTKQPLMDELRKVRRVLEKAAGRPPDETLLVLDATTGQNGIAQARAFTDAVEVTGVALTKLDGTAKGGFVLAVREQLGLPVKLIGMGEAIEDLEPFEPRTFADRLLSA
ncbi:MAG TPA: signal recognition particle-docking protein FtsY [Actinomycetota bacterium]|nr:signal recognition particle-docking protein FtsY [Actinomycetota bacterium]